MKSFHQRIWRSWLTDSDVLEAAVPDPINQLIKVVFLWPEDGHRYLCLAVELPKKADVFGVENLSLEQLGPKEQQRYCPHCDTVQK